MPEYPFGTPGGSGTPSASRSLPASSTAAHRASPAIRTSITRRWAASSVSQPPAAAGSVQRSATSPADSGPMSRIMSAAFSRSRLARSGKSRCSIRRESSTISGSSSSRRSAWPSSSASREESSASAWARRSASGASPSYMNAPT